MTIPLPYLLSGLLFLTALLAGKLALRLAKQNRAIEQLTKELDNSRFEAEQQKNKLAEQSDLDTVKDEFISTVSHELRTPLTSIRGALGLLSAGLLGNVDAKAHNLLRIASNNTERLIRLINDILDLERMESGRAPLTLRRCSIHDLAREAVDTMCSMAENENIRIELDSYTSRESIYFDADPDRILQVLTNLLSNAIKFSPAGSVISVQIDANQDSLLLKVMDQGRGIPTDKLEAVFDRFQQVESGDASKKGGTGLGLAICRSIVEQHSGAIWAQHNQDGPGTTMWLQFSRSARASDSGAPALMASPIPRGHGRILICDDDAGIRIVVAEQLRRHGYDILEARSGEEAVAIAMRHFRDGRRGEGSISAVLLDLNMPGLSGWETLQRLKSIPETQSIPVVILSVVPAAERGGGTHGEIQGWVQKPFNENMLLAELGRILDAKAGPGQVLLVEDDYDLASLIVQRFEQAGVLIDHAATLRQATERCLLGPPDLLILDVSLPDGDGFSLVDWMRRQPAFRNLPLVVYSGREISETEMQKLRLGPTQFLTKGNVKPQQVEALVLALVQRIRNAAANTAA
jgi:signal transduction histidine kinase/DNA-binding response OmpR family regulator